MNQDRCKKQTRSNHPIDQRVTEESLRYSQGRYPASRVHAVSQWDDRSHKNLYVQSVRTLRLVHCNSVDRKVWLKLSSLTPEFLSCHFVQTHLGLSTWGLILPVSAVDSMVIVSSSDPLVTPNSATQKTVAGTGIQTLLLQNRSTVSPALTSILARLYSQFTA